ncbi:MAG TPA: hypothetical protein VGP33_03410, partial [Chloroflexota bacterium]|nr:hypothetical protein [Chloroflexota bacterium]
HRQGFSGVSCTDTPYTGPNPVQHGTHGVTGPRATAQQLTNPLTRARRATQYSFRLHKQSFSGVSCTDTPYTGSIQCSMARTE